MNDKWYLTDTGDDISRSNFKRSCDKFKNHSLIAHVTHNEKIVNEMDINFHIVVVLLFHSQWERKKWRMAKSNQNLNLMKQNDEKSE